MSGAPVDMRELEGAVLGERYQLERFLDEGAFGAVFKATHLAYGVPLREVAIKIAKRPMTDAEARRTFADALLMAKVADAAPAATMREHFVTTHDAGRFAGGPLDGHPFLVMELVRGGSLKGCLRPGPFPLTRASAYFHQILAAMAFMHARPVVHRDLKPANILVTRTESTDVLKVTDFGLAIEVDALLGWVESGGDLAYLAPESFSHDVCSPQSDVYMLGLVFVEMLTGRAPFGEVGAHLRGDDEAKRQELRRLHLSARQLEAFAALDANAELKQRPALLRVVRRALAPDMTSRYANAIELRNAWQTAHAEGSGGVAADAGPEPVWETVRRLLRQAEQCLAVEDTIRGEELLWNALALQRDRSRVPDSQTVGGVYKRLTERLLAAGKTEEAGRLANEGFNRRRCRSTLEAMVLYFAATGSPLASRFQQDAQACPDE